MAQLLTANELKTKGLERGKPIVHAVRSEAGPGVNPEELAARTV